jgi:hypothetical protein
MNTVITVSPLQQKLELPGHRIFHDHSIKRSRQ